MLMKQRGKLLIKIWFSNLLSVGPTLSILRDKFLPGPPGSSALAPARRIRSQFRNFLLFEPLHFPDRILCPLSNRRKTLMLLLVLISIFVFRNKEESY